MISIDSMQAQSFKGFTFLELLIVLAIAILLATVAIPNFLNVREQNRRNVITKALKAFSVAQESYRAVQVPPSYAPDLAALRSTEFPKSGPWTQIETHGYRLTYQVPAAPASTYSFLAVPPPGILARVYYCVDATGMISSSSELRATAQGCLKN